MNEAYPYLNGHVLWTLQKRRHLKKVFNRLNKSKLCELIFEDCLVYIEKYKGKYREFYLESIVDMLQCTKVLTEQHKKIIYRFPEIKLAMINDV